MSESSEVQLARLEERMDTLLDRMRENHESQVQTRAWMGQVDRTLLTISSRVSNVEQSLVKNVPTIEEFTAIKNKVVGAGLAGRWLWVSMGAILGFVITLRENLSNFLSGPGV